MLLTTPFLVRGTCSVAQLYVNSNSIGAKFIRVNGHKSVTKWTDSCIRYERDVRGHYP
jgi:Cys-tRNA synthase (O-phospho-L-seryl-tRNA:Cys-tRNA synthase)